MSGKNCPESPQYGGDEQTEATEYFKFEIVYNYLNLSLLSVASSNENTISEQIGTVNRHGMIDFYRKIMYNKKEPTNYAYRKSLTGKSNQAVKQLFNYEQIVKRMILSA